MTFRGTCRRGEEYEANDYRRRRNGEAVGEMGVDGSSSVPRCHPVRTVGSPDLHIRRRIPRMAVPTIRRVFAYLFTGPIACTIWMLFIAPFGFDREKFTFVRRHVRYMGFMVSGFFGSILAETVLMIVLMKLFPHGGNRHLIGIFAVAPFAVFAPVLLVLLSRWIRRDEYATAYRHFGK